MLLAEQTQGPAPKPPPASAVGPFSEQFEHRASFALEKETGHDMCCDAPKTRGTDDAPETLGCKI